MSIVLIALCGTGGQQNESEASLKLWASAAAAVAQIPITSHLLPRTVVLVVVVVVGHRGVFQYSISKFMSCFRCYVIIEISEMGCLNHVV